MYLGIDIIQLCRKWRLSMGGRVSRDPDPEFNIVCTILNDIHLG